MLDLQPSRAAIPAVSARLAESPLAAGNISVT
jgi:hypothetical protein